MADSIIISNLPTHTPVGSDYLAIEDSSVTGKAAVDDVVAAAAQVQTNASAIGTLPNLTTTAKGNLVAAINEVDAHADTNASAISQLNSKFITAGDVLSVQFGVTDTNLQIRFDCGTARGVYYLNINRGTAQLSLMRTYNGQTTTVWTLP